MKKFTYFMRELGAEGRIKIGESHDPLRRLAEANTMSAYGVELLGVTDKPYLAEPILHRVFANSRTNGEWFKPTWPLMVIINNCTTMDFTTKKIKPKSRKRFVSPKPRIPRKANGSGWVEFKPGAPNKNGERKYYAKYRKWNKDGTKKVWDGRVDSIPPLTEDEYEAWKLTREIQN